MLVHIDNIALFGTLDDIQAFKMQITMCYKVTDVGEVSHFLRLHITHDHSKKTHTIDQMHYIQRMLTRFDMSQYHPVYTPFAVGTRLEVNPDSDSKSSLTSCYQQIVGSLMYIMLGSCPNICFTVNQLSQFSSKPTETHLLTVQHVLWYLSTTRDYKLAYGNNDSTKLISYCDSDWAADTDDCCSTSCYTFILSGGSIAWATQKQCTVVLSSTEAEYMALTECVKHAQWTLLLLDQLDFDTDLPIEL